MSAGSQKKRKHKRRPRNFKMSGLDTKKMKEFYDFHFPTPEKYVGYVPICSIKGSYAPKNCGFYAVGTLADALDHFEFNLDRNYYITANSFQKMERKQEKLFSFHNIVIDVDNQSHQPVSREVKEKFVSCFLAGARDTLFDVTFPLPNTIVCTGRGFQLWWSLEQITASAFWIADTITEYLAQCIEKIISKMGKNFDLKVDKAASKNKNGLFRMPGTFNVSADMWGTITFVHQSRLCTQAFYDILEELNRENEADRKISLGRRFGLDVYTPGVAGAERRANKLLALIELRQKTKVSTRGDEMRDLFLFCAHCILAQTLPLEAVHSFLEDMNKKFLNPMPEREWKNYMKSADVVQYKITNDTIIEKLCITPKEQRAIGLLPTAETNMLWEKRQVEQKEERRKAKEQRNKKISYHYKKKRDFEEIAQKAGCSEATVRRQLKRKGKKTDREERKELILEAVRQGATIAEAAAKANASYSTAYSIVNRAMKSGLLDPSMKLTKGSSKEETDAKQERNKKILAAFCDGMTIKEISQMMELSYSTVFSIIDKVRKAGGFEIKKSVGPSKFIKAMKKLGATLREAIQYLFILCGCTKEHYLDQESASPNRPLLGMRNGPGILKVRGEPAVIPG